jgi:hypothetical protein
MTDRRTTSQTLAADTTVPTSPSPAPPPALEEGAGMTVEEEVLRVVSAQLLYQLRCECGRSWFALELPTFVKCPACRKVGMVAL